MGLGLRPAISSEEAEVMTIKVRDEGIEFHVWVNNRREASIVASTHDEAMRVAERRWVGVRRLEVYRRGAWLGAAIREQDPAVTA
jgi:hypothetical protein